MKARLAALGSDERVVLEAAAMLGRHFDWRLLPAATDVGFDVMTSALEHGVGSLLLAVDGDAFRFRHALTREAVLEGLLPPRRVQLASRVLAAVEAAHPELDGAWRDVAAELASRTGDRERAGSLLVASGRDLIEQGALATAADTLRRATGRPRRGAHRLRARVGHRHSCLPSDPAAARCGVPHVGYVVSGRQMVRMDDGSELEIGPGDVISSPAGRDGWTVGDEPCVVIDFAGMATYAQPT